MASLCVFPLFDFGFTIPPFLPAFPFFDFDFNLDIDLSCPID
jgi:hypothetical protein